MDPTIELTHQEIRDRYGELLAAGHTSEEAAALLDTEYLCEAEWIGLYGKKRGKNENSHYCPC